MEQPLIILYVQVCEDSYHMIVDSEEEAIKHMEKEHGYQPHINVFNVTYYDIHEYVAGKLYQYGP